jgi:hypothetical protein
MAFIFHHESRPKLRERVSSNKNDGNCGPIDKDGESSLVSLSVTLYLSLNLSLARCAKRTLDFIERSP